MADGTDEIRGWAAPTSMPAPPASAPAGAPAAAPASATPASAAPTPDAPLAAPAPPTTPVGAPHTAPLTYRSWQPGIVPLRPLSFGDFLTVPFRAFRFNRAVTVGGPTVMTLASVVLTVLAGWLLITDPLLGIADFDPDFTGIQGTTVAALVVALLAWIAADLLASAVVLVGASRAVLGEHVSLTAAWRHVVPRIPQLLVLYVLTGAATVVASLPGIGLVVAFVLTGQMGLYVGGLAMLLVVGGAGGMVITVYLPAARGAVVMERMRAWPAIRRAVRLMKGRFWWTVLILLVTGTVVSVVAQVVQYATEFVAFIVIALAPDNFVLFAIVFAVGAALAMIFSYIVTYAFMGSVYALIYLDARMRREGFDVDLARAAEARFRTAAAV